MNNTCVCCGDIIPEGRQVCPGCNKLPSNELAETLTDVEIEMLVSFADNNMNLSETARQQFRHRNGIRYHLDKITERTGLNPFNFYDLVQLLKLCEEGSRQ